MAEKSIFEKICDHELPARIVLENQYAVAFHDIQAQAPIHLLIVPRKRIDRIAEAQETDAFLLGQLLLLAAEAAQMLNVTKSGYRLIINNGKDGGESVPHLHVHLLAGRALQWPPG